ncbi:MAG: P-II family nitrogen regulator [Gammaproteobacteria bacterium]|nr:P-II family nitrogen regulator [Gammaproteobacteria bacterium]
MKLITIIVNPHKVEDVRRAFTRFGVSGATVTEVKGYGRQRGHSEVYRGAEYSVEFRPKVKIEIGVHDDLCEQVIEAVIDAARTGKIGDGKVFVTELEQAMRIRTGEIGVAAI